MVRLKKCLYIVILEKTVKTGKESNQMTRDLVSVFSPNSGIFLILFFSQFNSI